MNTIPQVKIQLSKTKLTVMLLASITFVAIGIWMVTKQPATDHLIFDHQIFLLIFGPANILFFGLADSILLKKLKDKNPGLIVSLKVLLTIQVE